MRYREIRKSNKVYPEDPTTSGHAWNSGRGSWLEICLRDEKGSLGDYSHAKKRTKQVRPRSRALVDRRR